MLFSIYDFNWHRCVGGWGRDNVAFPYFSSTVDCTGGDVWALEKLLEIRDGSVGNVNCMLYVVWDGRTIDLGGESVTGREDDVELTG